MSDLEMDQENEMLLCTIKIWYLSLACLWFMMTEVDLNLIKRGICDQPVAWCVLPLEVLTIVY